MCFSATANFVGSAVLGTVGVITLTKVKHRRELMFASLPVLFAVHQLIEGFVWLGLDGILRPLLASWVLLLCFMPRESCHFFCRSVYGCSSLRPKAVVRFP
jgi:hypothetical protein